VSQRFIPFFPFFMVTLLVALVAGAVLRFWDIAALNLTHWDEGSYVAWPMAIGPYARAETLAVYAPPVYPSMNAFAFALLGDDPRVAIGVAALMGVLCIAMIGQLTRLQFGNIAGGVAALLFALDPFQVGYARMALTETTFTFFTLAALAQLTRLFGTGEGKHAVGAGVAVALAAGSKYHGVFPLLAAGLVVLLLMVLRGRGDVPSVKTLLARAIQAGLVALPFGLLLLWFVQSDMGIEQFRETRKTWLEGYHLWTFRSWWTAVLDSGLHFGQIGVLVLAPFGAVLALMRREPRDLLALAAPFVLMMILVPYISYTRLLVPFIALMVPLAAVAVARLAERTPRPRALALLVTLALACVSYANLRDTLAFRGDGYPKMAALLNERIQSEPGKVTIFVAQHAMYPYMDRDVAAACFSTTEPEGVRRLGTGQYEFVLTDQEPARHGEAKQFLSGDGAPTLTELFSVPNPMPAPILYDRLGREGFFRYRQAPDAPEFLSETRLRLFEVKK